MHRGSMGVRIGRICTIAALALVLMACQSLLSISPAPTTAVEEPSEIVPTVTPESTPTEEPEPTEAPTQAPTQPPTPTNPPAAQGTECTVTAQSLRLRSGPGTNFAIVAGLSSGTVVRASGRNAAGDWLSVETANGNKGWVATSFVRCSADPASLPEASAP
jgi:uncharacterized protein YgiM (DUF1202 family)